MNDCFADQGCPLSNIDIDMTTQPEYQQALTYNGSSPSLKGSDTREHTDEPTPILGTWAPHVPARPSAGTQNPLKNKGRFTSGREAPSIVLQLLFLQSLDLARH